MRHPIIYLGVEKKMHKIFKTLLAVVVATMTFCAEADTETVNGIEWTYTVLDGKASINIDYIIICCIIVRFCSFCFYFFNKSRE